MKSDNKKQKRNDTEAYKTFPLINTMEKEPITNVGIPRKIDVKEAKDWVDFNEK